MEKKYNWKEIYACWKAYSYNLKRINTPLKAKEIDIKNDHQDKYEIYGLDWVKNEHLDKRIKSFECTMNNFCGYFSNGFDMLNKGTLHTLEMLCAAQKPEECAAIWIYAFVHDLMKRGGGFPNCSMLFNIETESYAYLKDKFCMWHHAMRELTPEFYIYPSVIMEGNFTTIDTIINLIAVNSYMICNEYVPIFYRSDKNISAIDKNNVRYYSDN
jgi:hypothetical protein